MSYSVPPTITINLASQILGIGLSTAYASIRQGTFPTKVIQIGGRYVVPTKPLLDLLGLDELPTSDQPVDAA